MFQDGREKNMGPSSLTEKPTFEVTRLHAKRLTAVKAIEMLFFFGWPTCS